jgi:hypothetical protein
MRCTCGFNSFDHNLVCPKCHKDLTATRRLLNLDIPAPGVVNLFQMAGHRMVTPQPFLGPAGNVANHEEYLQPMEEITPVMPQVFAAPAEEPLIEIEVTDDIESDEPRPVNGTRPEAAVSPVNPWPAHQAAMDQIKSALTETGDLNPEADAYVLEARDVSPAPGGGGGGSGGGGEDLSSLVEDLNLDELEGDL